MFPISIHTEYHLVIAFIACTTAIAPGRWAWLAIAVSFPLLTFGILWRLPWDDPYVWVGLYLYLALAGMAIIGGLLWGWGMRKAWSKSSLLAASFASLPGIIIAGFVLHAQYVSADCIENGVVVTLNDQTIRLPNSGVYWNYRENNRSLTGGEYIDDDPITLKSYMSRYCRQSKNGTQPVAVDTVEVRPRERNATFELARSSIDLPRRWDVTNEKIYHQGSHVEGAECRSEWNWVACVVWITPAPSLRVFSTSSYPKAQDVQEILVEQKQELSDWFDSIKFE